MSLRKDLNKRPEGIMKIIAWKVFQADGIAGSMILRRDYD